MGRGSSSCESDCPRAGAGSSPKLGAPVGIEVLSCVHLLKMVCRAKCCSVLPCLTGNDLSCYVPVLTSIPLFLPPVPILPVLTSLFPLLFFCLAPIVLFSSALPFFLHYPLLPMFSGLCWVPGDSGLCRTPVAFYVLSDPLPPTLQKNSVIRRCLRDNGPSAFLPESPVSAVQFYMDSLRRIVLMDLSI